MRVPTPNVSLIEFVFNVKKNISTDKLNRSFIKASKKYLKNILNVTKKSWFQSILIIIMLLQ